MPNSLRSISNLLVCCALVIGIAYGQAPQRQPDEPSFVADSAEVTEAIAKVKSGNFFPIDVELIAQAGAVEAVPIMKGQFTASSDPDVKGQIASVLIRLGSKDDLYWDYLVQLATPAIESDAPTFRNIDAEGRFGPGPSPQFILWAQDHHVDIESAGMD